MIADDRRRALDGLNGARGAVARIDLARGPDATRSDLVQAWAAVEQSLRALLGDSPLTGQALIREVRARQLIAFEQANALAEFEAAHARAQRGDYVPVESDVNAVRNAFLKLESGLLSGGAGSVPSATAGAASPNAPRSPQMNAPSGTPPAMLSIEASPPSVAPLAPARSPRSRSWLLPAAGGLLIASALIGGWAVVRARGQSRSFEEGAGYYQSGQRELAEAAFRKAMRESPDDPRPHVYLARMAREVGNMTLASQELQLAIQVDPGSALAQREMGSYLLAANNPPLAARFYVRAIQLDSTDRSAMGWLGCALTRQNRLDEAQRWFQRAGAGDWSRCAQETARGTLAPNPAGLTIPRF